MEKETTKTKCPYTNFKDKVMKYIDILRIPRKEYGGLPACPFVGPEIDKGKLMIEKFDPNESTLLDKVKAYDESEYDSALFVQVLSDEEMLWHDTVNYQNYINLMLRDNGYEHLKCICFNPNDTKEVAGFNPRKDAPYFLINIASKKVLAKAHKSLLGTNYFQNFKEDYLKYLKVKEKDLKKD